MLSVQELQEKDVDHILKYWLYNEDEHLIKMGVDLKKLPEEQQLRKMLHHQIHLPYEEKKSLCMIWFLDEQAVGHCNVNQIIFGQSAFMHLHLWDAPNRKKGIGSQLVRLSLPYFFKHLQLKELFSEPYALNPAPNKTLARLGFHFVKKHVTIPGSLNFEQEVNRWKLNVSDLA